jgi:hypothetical protein
MIDENPGSRRACGAGRKPDASRPAGGGSLRQSKVETENFYFKRRQRIYEKHERFYSSSGI